MHESDLKFFTEISEENLVTFRQRPRVRVKMVEQQEYLKFETDGRFVLTDEQEQVLNDDFETDGIWRARVDAFTPPTYRYLLFVIEEFHIEKAKEITADLRRRGFQSWYKAFGYKFQISNEAELIEVLRYRVFVGPMQDKQKARNIQSQLLGVFHTQIIKIPYRHTRGILEIIDAKNTVMQKGTGFFRLTPKSSSGTITVFNLRNAGKRMPYTFHYGVEFHVADNGKLFLVGEMDIEEFITGLMISLYEPDYPVEFLKAMAIAYRSSVLANLRMSHINEPFDFRYSEPFFQFAWQDTVPAKLKKVIKEMAGKYLLKGDRICDARHTRICGGHTEHIDIMMNRDTRNSITGRYDVIDEKSYDFPFNLINETDAEEWIKSHPPTLCNLDGLNLKENFSKFSDQFRWLVEYSRQDLEEIISKKTDEDIGTIFDIVPLLRGGSGRLLEVEVLGSHRNVHLVGDHEIRSSLAENMLPSSCFVIKSTPGVDGSPAQFIFIGAGTGHGVGLCQAGAIALALKGMDYLSILKHYFGQIQVVSRLSFIKSD